MVNATHGVIIYFDPAEIAQYQLLGYTDGQLPVYRIFYQNGIAEDMVDAWSVMSTTH